MWVRLHYCTLYVNFGNSRICCKLFSYCSRTKPETADGHTSRIFDAIFHPQSTNEFISGGWDNTIQFWDVRQPNSIRYVTGAHICGEGIDIHRQGRDVINYVY